MILSDTDIKKSISQGTIKINPSPDFEEQLGPCSLDLHLGNSFKIFKVSRYPFIDLKNGVNVDEMMEEVVIKDGGSFIIQPHDFVIAVTKEEITLPSNIMGRLDGRSSLARLGLVIHVTAARFDPGWRGRAVMELGNLGTVPIVLYSGMRICAMTFESISSSSEVPYLEQADHKYADQSGATASKILEEPGLKAVPMVGAKIPSANKNHPEYQYLNLLQELIDKGHEQVDAGTGVKTYSLFGKQFRFDLSQGFPLLTTKKVFWKGVVQELYWFMSGQKNIKYLVDNNVHIWDDYPYRIYREKITKGLEKEMTKEEFIEKIATDKDFAELHGNLPHVYGDMWRHWPTKTDRTIDQLQWLISNIRNDKSTHSAIVNSWNPEYLYEMAAPGEACRFPICHNMFQINANGGRLSLQLYQRSCDVFLGVPFNIASYALLTIILAKITGNEPGEFIHTFGDIHYYENHLDAVKEQLLFPTVKIDQNLREIDDFKPESVELIGYESHPPIKASLSPVGGIVTKDWKEFVQNSKKN